MIILLIFLTIFSKPSNGSSDPPKFSFKSSEPAKSDSSKPSLFNLGGAPKTDSGDASKPAPFTFKFGAGASSLAGGAAPSFGFGAPPSSIPTPAPTGVDGEDEYQPPKVEETEFDDEKDALYTKKAKLFYSKDGNYKEIGTFDFIYLIITIFRSWKTFCQTFGWKQRSNTGES